MQLEEVIENRLVFCENPVLMSVISSRICKNSSEYEVYPEGIVLDFDVDQIETLNDLQDSLIAMNSVGIHIMGSRGYIYSSKVLAEIVEQYLDNIRVAPVTCFPRTFGLRAKVLKLLNE